jgi:YggT family protein
MGSIIHLLLKTVFDLYILVLLLRLLLQLCGAPTHNAIVKVILQLTRPLVVPLQKWLPSIAKINICVIFWLVILKTVELFLLSWLGGESPAFSGILVLSIGELLNQVLTLYFFALIIQAILSWVQPQKVGDLIEVLYVLTAPVLAPFQRFIPALGGIDFSALFAIILIEILKIAVVGPIISLGARMILLGMH